MTLPCRPRESGDPYAAAMGSGTAGHNRKSGIHGSPPSRGRRGAAPCHGHASAPDSRVRGKERLGFVSLLSALAVLLLTLTGSVAYAADDPFYRGKTISLIVGSNTSGGYDTYGRLLA